MPLAMMVLPLDLPVTTSIIVIVFTGAMENAVDTEDELNATKQMQIFYDSCVGSK